MTLVWAPGFNGVTDPDAQTYLAAVEAADGQAIEGDVALAINDFVVGCKLDGIWDAIKASCILAGARTLSGALVPLKGTAPTNNNFVSGDYNRETGLVGDGSTKYLNSNRANNADPQNDVHQATYVSAFGTVIPNVYIGAGDISDAGATHFGSNVSTNVLFSRCRSATAYSSSSPLDDETTGFIGMSRSVSTDYVLRGKSQNQTFAQSSSAPTSDNVSVFFRSGGTTGYSDARISFYSIGEAIDLEKLDTRTTRLMNLLSYSLASGLPALSSMDLDAASYIGGGYRAGGTLS